MEKKWDLIRIAIESVSISLPMFSRRNECFFSLFLFLCRLCLNATHFCKAENRALDGNRNKREWKREKYENRNKLVAPSVARSIHLIKSLYTFFVYFVGQSARACHCYRKIIIVCMAEKCVYKIWWLCRFWFSVSTVVEKRDSDGRMEIEK